MPIAAAVDRLTFRYPSLLVDHIAEHEPGRRVVAVKNVTVSEEFFQGHFPGEPLLPGVLMIECAAQLASFYTRKFVGWKGFIGFGGADEIRFRQAVAPGVRMHLIGQKLWERHRRINCKIQGIVKGNMVFECSIVGTEI